MCSVNLRRLLGKNNKPENQKVNENNKEEIKKGRGGNWSQNTACGIDQKACCDMFARSHFTSIQSSPINIGYLFDLSRGKLNYFALIIRKPSYV